MFAAVKSQLCSKFPPIEITFSALSAGTLWTSTFLLLLSHLVLRSFVTSTVDRCATLPLMMIGGVASLVWKLSENTHRTMDKINKRLQLHV